MDNITGVIDMDGFTINKIFYCKELACIRKGQTYATSTLFDLGLQWKDLSEKDKKAARFVERYIHKIRFTSPPNQPTVPLFRLPDIVKEFFSEPDALVAYKGGHFEKDLLYVEWAFPPSISNLLGVLKPNYFSRILDG
jgi:hypothetical protein